jgi:hypothetical protein
MSRLGPRNSQFRTATARLRILLCCGGWIAAMPLLAGCAARGLDFDYGRRSSVTGNPSVNGTSVLSEMFVKAGHPVDSKRALTPGLENVQTIVWFPNSLKAPSEDVLDWFDVWLRNEPGRTLVYVGRGYDAQPLFWRKTKAKLPDQRAEADAAEVEAKEEFARDLKKLPSKEECKWFELVNDKPAEEIGELAGPWAAGVDASKIDLELTQRLIPPNWFEWLLESDENSLVSREVVQARGGSHQVVLVTNGSFLLNFSLVNREHRKLAGRLIDLVDGERVVFLESGADGPPIMDSEPSPSMRQGFDLFGVWPVNVVLLHLAVMGIIFGFARWPIFGKPKQPAAAPGANFAQHATALGKLLERTGDRDYALRRLAEYRNP